MRSGFFVLRSWFGLSFLGLEGLLIGFFGNFYWSWSGRSICFFSFKRVLMRWWFVLDFDYLARMWLALIRALNKGDGILLSSNSEVVYGFLSDRPCDSLWYLHRLMSLVCWLWLQIFRAILRSLFWLGQGREFDDFDCMLLLLAVLAGVCRECVMRLSAGWCFWHSTDQ